MNAVEIEEALSALAEAPFEPAEFPYQFLTAFGNKDTAAPAFALALAWANSTLDCPFTNLGGAGR
ncbi:hypothetical protein [Pseudoxanthomonas winnipegensis]|uniref:hypothetical protein n=1 Tax=Pseudoxanthomonas winnipegensis TaxID=2480810 RepID=UPI0030F44B86